jgi:hypothetical protein
MKKLIVVIVLTFTGVATFAQSEKYFQMMKSTLVLLDSAKVNTDFMSTANRFELIANKEKSQWLPFYYAAYCNHMMCNYGLKGDEIDAVCDKADAQLHIADSLQPNNSEIIVMKARLMAARIMVNPMARGAKFGRKSAEILQQAMAIDSLNPRIYLSQSQALFYTPKMFGGGKDKAKPVLQKTLNCYTKFKPASELHPNWGLNFASYLFSECEIKK